MEVEARQYGTLQGLEAELNNHFVQEEDIEPFVYGDHEFQQKKCYLYSNPETPSENTTNKSIACLDLDGFLK